MGYLYLITCSVTDKVYVGSTIRSLRQRWNKHMENFRKQVKKEKNTKLYAAMETYGVNNFHIEMLDTEDDNDLLVEYESLLIEHYNSINNGYNVLKRGRNYRPTVEQNRSNSIKNRKYKDELEGLPPKCSYEKCSNVYYYRIRTYDTEGNVVISKSFRVLNDDITSAYESCL